MGVCCTRQQEVNFDIKNCIQYSPEEANGIMRSEVKPELKLEENKLEIGEEEIQLTKIINRLQYFHKNKVQIFTEIELFNLAIYYKDNYINSEYLIFDMRISSEQKEDYLKKIKHINYTYEQIKNIRKIKKFEVLQAFIDYKKIIIIIPQYYLNPRNNSEGYKKVEDYPVDLCELLYNINNTISFKILNSCLNNEEEKTEKFKEYLSVFHSYDIIPFILFTYKHMTTFYKEGFFFINFFNKNIFSFEDYINNLNNTKNNQNNNFGKKIESNLKHKFLSEMSITTIFNIDNDIKNMKNSLEIKDFHYQRYIYKEININKNNIKNEPMNINSICEWLKQEIIKGHSCYFNIENYDLNNINNDDDKRENNWIFIIIILITLVTEVEYSSVIDYLREKIIYIDNIDKEFEENVDESEISDTLDQINLESF